MAFYQSDCKIGKAFSNDLSSNGSLADGWNVVSGAMPFPQKGIWRVTCEHRFHFRNEATFCYVKLSTSSSAGSGLMGDARWWQEKFGISSSNNAFTHNSVWFLNLGPDLSFAYNIYLHLYFPSGRTITTRYTTNDSNGVPRCTAYLVAGTTTNGASVIEP